MLNKYDIKNLFFVGINIGCSIENDNFSDI